MPCIEGATFLVSKLFTLLIPHAVQCAPVAILRGLLLGMTPTCVGALSDEIGGFFMQIFAFLAEHFFPFLLNP